VNAPNDASSITALTASKDPAGRWHCAAAAPEQFGTDGTTLAGISVMTCGAHRARTGRSSLRPVAGCSEWPVCHIIGIRRQQLQCAGGAVGLHLIDDAVLRADQRASSDSSMRPTVGQVAAALQHVGEARQIGLEPVLFGVAIRR